MHAYGVLRSRTGSRPCPRFARPAAMAAAAAGARGRCCCVCGLPPNADDMELRRLFGVFGPIATAQAVEHG
eukprot:8925292-Lingulodinium_polyedra.AAC.1